MEMNSIEADHLFFSLSPFVSPPGALSLFFFFLRGVKYRRPVVGGRSRKLVTDLACLENRSFPTLPVDSSGHVNVISLSL